jgi:hypothetical protein
MPHKQPRSTLSRPVPEPPAQIADLLTVREVATWIGRRCDTIRGWILNGELVAYNVGSDAFPRYMVKREDVLRRFRVVRPVVLTRSSKPAAKQPRGAASA